jgi:hypothetical protein
VKGTLNIAFLFKFNLSFPSDTAIYVRCYMQFADSACNFASGNLFCILQELRSARYFTVYDTS